MIMKGTAAATQASTTPKGWRKLKGSGFTFCDCFCQAVPLLILEVVRCCYIVESGGDDFCGETSIFGVKSS